METLLVCIPLTIVLTIAIISGVLLALTKDDHYLPFFIVCSALSLVGAPMTSQAYIEHSTKHGVYMKCVSKYQEYFYGSSTADKSTIHANCESLIKSI
jgi:hypothetical protein